MPVGVRGGLVDWKHVERMDRAVFLFLWAVLRQTGSGKDGRGVVNYGKPVTIGQIADEIRAPYATIRKWLARLEEYGYLKRASFADNSFALFVCSEKKFHKNPQYRDRPYTDGDSDRIRTETPTIYDHRLASKPKKTFGFTPPNVKDIRKECKELRPDEPAESLPLNSKPEPPEEKPPSLRDVAREKQLPRASKSAAELDAERRRQLDGLEDLCKRMKIRGPR